MKNNIDQIIIEMWEQGKSGGEIANELGVTRSSVMGRIYRLREAKKIKYRAQKILIKSDRIVRTKNKSKPYKKIRIFVPADQIISTPNTGVSILDLHFWSCRYVVGDPKMPLEKIYCGQVADKHSYCKDHKQLCYQPTM